jgi:hypothetical protein
MDGHPTEAIDHRPACFWKGLETARRQAMDLQEIHPAWWRRIAFDI